MAADLDWNPPKGKGGTRPFSNPLLVRPELAKCKATTYDLPGPGHTYGKALERDREDAGAVVASWQEHVKNPQAQPGVDFRTLNRDAIIQGNISAKDNDEFRKHNADKPAYKLKQGEAGGSKLYLPSEGNADYLYGKASRPSTPIEFLMTNSYQRSFVEDQKEQDVVDNEVTTRRSGTQVRQTKGSLARGNCVKEAIEYSEETKEDYSWKMSKFKAVPGRLHT